jgi:hypothetical protein
MKKIIVVLLVFLLFNFSFLNVFAQTTSDQAVAKLTKDIKVLQQKNNSLKKQVAENVIALNKSMADLKELIQVTDNKANSIKESVAATNVAVSTLTQDTGKKFSGLSGILTTAIVLALLILVALTVAVIQLKNRLRKEIVLAKELATDQISEAKKLTTAQIDALKSSLEAQIIETQKTVKEKPAKSQLSESVMKQK